VRITRSPDGVVIGGSSKGRGAWLCRDDSDHRRIDERCIAASIGKRGFARAWRITIDHNDEKNIREHIASFGHEGPAVAGDSGRTL